MSCEEKSGCKLKAPLDMDQNIIPEDYGIIKDTSKSVTKPPVPSIKDTIKILNTENKNTSSPAVNRTVPLTQSNQLSNKIIKLNNVIEEEKSHKNTIGNETKLYIEKKKKERTEKKKIDLLKKQKLAEERKKKLADLQKTTRALAKASIKKKTINHHDQNECKISLSLSTESNHSEVDQTWSPPLKVKSFKKISETPFDVQKNSIKDLEKIYYDDSNSCLNTTKNNKKIHQPVECIEEDFHNSEKKHCENLMLKERDMFDINLNKKPQDIVNITTGTNTDIQLFNQSYKQIMNSSDHLIESQELVLNQFSPNKTCHSESTQTDNCENLLSIFSSKIDPPPLNFISVLRCKSNLQKKKNIDLEFSKPEIDLKINDYNFNKCMDNIKSPVCSNVLEVVDCDKSLDLQNLNHNVKENLFIGNEFELNLDTVKSKSYCPLLETTENNVCEEKSDLNNVKLFPEINKITNDDIKQALKNLNCHFDSSTEYSNKINDSNMHLKSIKNNPIDLSSPFHEIHDEFQAELSTLDQLNDSLYDIEKMSSAMSTKTDDSFDDELNNHSNSNDFSSKIILNTAYSNKYKPTSISKLNALSSNMITVDKTITGFSIQMFEQLIKDEELRAKQHHTILNLREKSLINRLKWEVSMCELQMKSIKNQTSYEKHLQTFKQKQRGSVKKLEHSLSQVKRLGRVIDSVYKKRLIMLNEHLQYLKTQSSSKNVIRKLRSLDQIPKKDEYTYGTLNSIMYKQYDKTNIIDTIEYEKEHNNLNLYELNTSSKNNLLQSVKELHKSNVLLQDQATSPIHTEIRSLKKVESIPTDNEKSLQSFVNKCTQTSKSLCNYENKLTEVKKTLDKNSQLAVFLTTSTSTPTSSTKTNQYYSETSNSPTNSEQSDMELRITTLQEKLEARKIESFILKKEQKKLRLENLKAKEQDLLKQIELYDKKIEESKKSLIVDIEKKNIQIKHDFSSKNSNYSILQNMIKSNVDHNMKKSQCLSASDKILLVDGTKHFYPIEIKKSNNHNNITSLEKPLNQKNIDIESNADPNKYTENCDFVDSNDFNLETKVCEVVPPKEMSVKKVKTLKECDEIILIEVNNVPLKSELSNVPVQSSMEETRSDKLNILVDTSINPLYNNSIQTLKTPIISSSQELYLEKNINTEKLPISCSSLNNNHSNTNSSSSSDNQRKFSIDFNDTDNVSEKNGNHINPLEISNGELEVDNNYSLDFTSVENTSECQKSYELNTYDNIIELKGGEENNESSSYEEERSEGDIMFEDKTFIEQFSDDGYLVHDEIAASDKVDVITNNIFNNLLKDSKITLKSNTSKTLVHSGKCDLNNLTEDTPLLMILKREEEHQHIVFLSEQARTISNDLLNRNLHHILSEILPMYLSRLNELQLEKLKLYLNWVSSKRKKLKLPKCLSFQNKTNDVDNAESFEIFYQKYQNQKKSPTIQNESSDVMLSQTQEEAEKLKLEQIRIEKEIERLHMTEKTQFVQRNIPIKPPPPYKSPTKKKSLADIPYTSDEMYKIVLTAASQLFNNDSQLSLLKDYVIDSESNLHYDYKTLIFDYCKEIVQETFNDEKNVPIWKKSTKRLKNFRSRPKNPEDLSDTVIKKINHIKDIEECEEKVNKFVVKQMHEEDSKWFDFQMDELDIQNDIVESLMQKLLCDTITDIKTSFYLKFIR